MDRERIREFARNFHENGMKLLLENPKNLRDLLMLVSRDIAERIDLDRVRLVKETFVRRDYRDVHTDIVLTAPLRGEPDRGKRVWIDGPVQDQLLVFADLLAQVPAAGSRWNR